MKTKTIILTALTFLPLMSAFAQTQAPVSVAPPGYLADYKYQVTNVSTMAEAQAIMDLQNTDFRKRSICASRAHFWSYDLSRRKNIQVGKVFIHFTPKGQANESKEWAYHVAPYIIVNGEEMVLDSGFWHFEGKPATMTEWQKYFGKSEKCVVLDPINNPAHLKLEQNNMPNDWTLPKDYKSGNSRQYPTPRDSTCYIRKVPMYYAFPLDVYGSDLFLAGDQSHKSFYMEKFNPVEVLNACDQAMDRGFKGDHSCEEYFGLKKPRN